MNSSDFVAGFVSAMATTAHSENSSTESCTGRNSSQSKDKCLAETWSGSEEGSYLRFIDSCMTRLEARE